MVSCPICGIRLKRAGLGPHKLFKHGIKGEDGKKTRANSNPNPSPNPNPDPSLNPNPALGQGLQPPYPGFIIPQITPQITSQITPSMTQTPPSTQVPQVRVPFVVLEKGEGVKGDLIKPQTYHEGVGKSIGELKDLKTVEMEFSPIDRKLSLSPIVLLYYDYWRKEGYEGDLGDFITDCIVTFFEERGLKFSIIKEAK